MEEVKNIKPRLLSEEEFKKLDNPGVDVEKEKEELRNNLKDAYGNIIDLLKEYIDIKPEYFNIIALWIIGTYFHKQFPSYPFLYFNAMKGSGKSRTMNLITTLAKDGEMLNSLTEAVLFRTTGTLGIDEYEGITRKGNEGLRELLNSCYKRGIKVKRMKQKKTIDGTEQVIEEFEVYRPIVMANIWGMEEVLGDRCIPIILDKSNRKEVTNLIEIFDTDERVIQTKEILTKCSLCSFIPEIYKDVYKMWNSYIKHNYTNYTNNTYYTNYTNYTELFKTINLMDLNGRELELSFPLCLIASLFDSEFSVVSVVTGVVLEQTTLTLKAIFSAKKEEELVENQDVNLIDFISQELQDNNFIPLTNLLEKFRESFGIKEDWVNSRWLGKALKRLNLIKEKRRRGRGVEVVLDYEKAQRQIKIFKDVETEK